LKGSSFYDLGGNEKKVINNIVSLLSVFSFTETLLDTFKQFSADPDFVKKSWKNDKTGESDISMTLAFALRQSLSRVLFLSNSRSALKKLLGSDDLSNLTQIRKSFVDNLIPLEITKGDDQKIYSWLSKNFSNIGISIGSGSELSFQTNNVRFTIFFATFSELIFNAIKYFDGQGEISISWEESESGFLFQCKNTFDDNAGQPNQLITPNSTNSGLYFVKRLMSQLEKSRFTIAFQNNLYVASLFFSKDNF
jgi:two-component sensor histidine kinase